MDEAKISTGTNAAKCRKYEKNKICEDSHGGKDYEPGGGCQNYERGIRGSSQLDEFARKTVLFVVLLLHTLLIYTLIRIKKIKNINYKLKDESIIFMSEIMKFIISVFFYFSENKFSIKLVKENVKDIIVKKKLYLISLLVPSILYYFQNIFFYISMSNIPTPLFQLLYQFRILVVVIFTFILLKRKIKMTQMISMTFLFLSLVCLKDYNIDYNFYAEEKGKKEIISRDTSHEFSISKDSTLATFRDKFWDKKKILFYSFQNKSLSSNIFVLSLLLSAVKRRNVYSNGVTTSCSAGMIEGCTSGDHLANAHIGNAKLDDRIGNAKLDDRIGKNAPVQINRKEKTYKINNIIVGILTTFLATFTSGFSSVFLESLYIKYRNSFWLQNIFLALFTIILSIFTTNLNISSFLYKLSKNDLTVEEHSSDNNSLYRNTQNEYFFYDKVKNFFFQYFNSINEFAYICTLIILNSIGGIITSIFIKYVGSFPRFFITPLSLLFNVYISAIYFQDFHFTFNYLISLAFVFFTLYFYVKENIR
ncbi:UDP-N-acetyl glucosamine:UMP antiporter, putative [Plasmodium ovale wallikeri]|uniref:UDP-N-acetyl glucosamine:UMP antiporter, putative n=2 Tax=Plasmodium ovale TaxID=36330 RepID=A0A1A8YZX8_PLAOA|nr:UDP-N-acetyl glucosamine:UMP antiporter, putative [Plasmodium ovale wallikeri]SBT37026.1 UDP-N-acetyl glucosamine:UMP antiporter, putative [Plasmodium ovale wallikeri]SBT72833.1 UDP-N-acetylglucosamine transporter, putative [Plasmodium ovale]